MMGNSAVKLLFAAKSCRRHFSISRRTLENFKLVADKATYSEDLGKFVLSLEQQKLICKQQKIVPATLEAYLKSFNNALLHLGGAEETTAKAEKILANGKIGTQYLLLACLASMKIRSHADLRRFWRRELESRRRPYLSKPAERFFQDIIFN